MLILGLGGRTEKEVEEKKLKCARKEIDMNMRLVFEIERNRDMKNLMQNIVFASTFWDVLAVYLI